jgi:integrase
MVTNTPIKRKAVYPNEEHAGFQAEVYQLCIEEMVLSPQGKASCHFKRLKYKGCPKLTSLAFFPEKTKLIDMNRDAFIRDCYQIMKVNVNATTSSLFDNLIGYLRWCDESEKRVQEADYLESCLIRDYMQEIVMLVEKGILSAAQATNRKKLISWLLIKAGRSAEAKSLTPIKRPETLGYQSLDIETELREVARSLFRAYRIMLKHFLDGSPLERHPLYDEKLIEREVKRQGGDIKALAASKAAFKTALIRTNPNNHIVSTAAMITFMFTGMNTTPLCKMRISDLTFREISGGKYIFNTEKGRAGFQLQDNSMGFSKYAKEFIESWSSVSLQLAKGDESSFLFPRFTDKGEAISYAHTTRKPQLSINKLLKRMGLPKINPSIFRKTKSDTVFRVTESVYLVSMMNNNEIGTTAKIYINGTKKEHERNLGAAMAAQHAIALGNDVDKAVASAKFQFSDVLDGYEYDRLRKKEDRTNEARTPLGVRCNNNKKGTSQFINKILKREGIEASDSEAVCTDFLACFECQEHAFVSDVEDIWLMLSFRDTLLQLQQLPAVNSLPEKKYLKLFANIQAVLQRFNNKSPKEYKLASEKLKNAPHPLYASIYSLNDLLDVFAVTQ